VIEEAPAPGMDEATREQLCAAAVKAAKAVDYVGAGTIEFIADASEGLRADRIWFMEMNTRLQVEHPVTEEITGVDLVEWQLRVASGEALPKRQDQLAINGWAMEARLYAEDPATGFLPSVGPLIEFEKPVYCRWETGVEQDDDITPFYDPMIAKIVMHGEDREEARLYLRQACTEVRCAPVKTNAWFLIRALDTEAFVDGNMTTSLIEQEYDALTAKPVLSEAALQSAAEHVVYGNGRTIVTATSVSIPDQPLTGFRLNAQAYAPVSLLINGERCDVDYDIASYGELFAPDGRFEEGSSGWFYESGALFTFAPYRAATGKAGAASSGTILSPMPGRIIAVEVTEGQSVTKGQKLVTLEAMKMEHSLSAPFDGVVAELSALVGGQVSEGMILVVVVAGAG
jgi:3-methylcrotonyl-CoA carboxylase alpha subunit